MDTSRPRERSVEVASDCLRESQEFKDVFAAIAAVGRIADFEHRIVKEVDDAALDARKAELLKELAVIKKKRAASVVL